MRTRHAPSIKGCSSWNRSRGRLYGPQVFQKLKSVIEHSTTEVNLDDFCMLSTTSCEQESISMSLDRETAQPSSTHEDKSSLGGAASRTLMLSLTGLEMEMGSARFQLKNIGNNTYEGDVILPVCALDKMTWIGELTDGVDTVNPAIRMAR